MERHPTCSVYRQLQLLWPLCLSANRLHHCGQGAQAYNFGSTVALAAGTKLGPYEIISPLGKGGMGEVYRAKDTRLDREVAIKVLPEQFSRNSELRQRFEREARAISSLSHAHICHLYDIGSQGGVDYLVMEYLQGETLADRLLRGPLPLHELMKIGIEIADALEKAHRQGIVHRDLKPGNIMLSKSGTKLMDFGLAKAVASSVGIAVGAAGVPLTPSSPTSPIASLTRKPSPLTQKGTVVGTFHYMAPEVLRGEEADARSDIFSLGCALYEGLTGKRAFEGQTQISVLAAILEKDPDSLIAVQPIIPPALEHVILTCLAKDPDRRWQSASDVARELEWMERAPESTRRSVKSLDRRREWVAWAMVAFFAILLAGALLWPKLHKTSAVPILRASLVLGNGVEVLPFDMAFSPDGSKLAFVARSGNQQALWVRAADSMQANRLPSTEDARYPFWSPDGRHVGFFSGMKLRTIDVDGSMAVALADAPDPRGGSWSKDDIIAFAASYEAPLMQIPASGGVVSPLTVLNTANHETTHRWPLFLPDGRHLLFFVEGERSTGAPSADPTDKTSGLYLFDIKTNDKRFLISTDSGVGLAAGHLIYLRQQALIAQPFDVDAAKIKGPPIPLLQQQVAYDSDRWSGAFAVTSNGLLAYVTGRAAAFSQLQWIERSGRVLGKVGRENGIYLYPALSPDGTRVAVQEDSGHGSDIWILDLQRQTKARLTFDGQSTCPVWSPDGKMIAYASDRGRMRLVFVKDANGLGKEQQVNTPGGADHNILTDWSRDGRAAIMASQAPTFRFRLFVHWFQAGHKDDWLLAGAHYAAREATFAPDGKWVAYSSDESGRWEVYVVPFPDVNGKFQISTDGGMQPRWRRDGKELYYLGLDRKLMGVAISTIAGFKPGLPQQLIATNPFITAPVGTAQYDVSPDGKRFLVSSRLEESTAEPITILTNWTAQIRK